MSHAIPKEPKLSFIKGRWQVLEDQFVFWRGFDFKIPEGYRCDLGSVPWLFTWIVQPTGKGNLGFLAHDYVYDDDQPLPKNNYGEEMTREQGDKMMRDLLEYAGMAEWRAFVAWRGVRRGGWMSWKKED